ncbi:MAG: hypothetical protein C0591_00770 [Marinilabiliales bacterium]|nr:MAG: hypothetical protein C0591_00770 [Marinilabiliales bacterium]
MKIKLSILSIVMIFSALAMNAQIANSNAVIIYNDPQIENLVELHIDYNEEFPLIDGYRIQLLMRAGNTALDEANQIKDEFEENYPEINTYVTFREPYYRLRVGDFRTRLEAMEFMEKLKRSYPQAWVIKDKITFPEFTKYKNTINYE